MKTYYDLIVVGGGFSGFCTAVAAAREGMDVLIVERWNCLGGAACGNLVNPFMHYWMNLPETRERVYLNNGIFREIIDEMEELGGYNQPQKPTVFDEEILKLVLNRKAVREGISLLYNTTVYGTEVTDGKIQCLHCTSRGVSFDLNAEYYVDATGDAELSVMAGVPFHVGREEDHLCQPMTLCFRMGGIHKDYEDFKKFRAMINPLYKQFREEGKIKNCREDVLIFENINEGVLHFNSTRVVRKNPTDPWDVTEAEIEAREQVYELLHFLKDNIPGFEDARVLSTSMQIGTRESRMIEGLHTLTAEDLMALTRFEDAIAVGNYDMDIHNPEGTGTSHYFFRDGEYYTIPYRCLVPVNMHNMLTVGRCISSTHEAQAAYRIMPIVANIGEAAGTALGIAFRTHAEPGDVDIKAVQEKLRANGALV